MVGYPGSKTGSGVSERIIRQMPLHEIYVEAFAGRAAVFRKKRSATSSLLIDCDPAVCAHLRSYLATSEDAEVGRAEVMCGDVLDLVPSIQALQAPTTLAYFDPPYLRETRTRLLYDFEFATREAHTALLALILELPCMAMISGYKSELYAKILSGRRWRVVKIPTMTRGGKRIEHLWCNFPEPDVLHDPRWAGRDFRERERIKKKQQRWTAKFNEMHPRERQAIAAALVNVDRTAVDAAMRISTPAAKAGSA